MSTLKKIKEKLNDFEKRKQELLNEIQKDFPSIFAPLFEKSSRINEVSWTQYTDYFNDGDECRFHVHIDSAECNGYNPDNDSDNEEGNFISSEIYAKITSENLESHKAYCSRNSWSTERSVDEFGYMNNPNFDEKESKIFEEFKEALSELDQSFFKDLFGDHKDVTIYRDGTIYVSDYTDHE